MLGVIHHPPLKQSVMASPDQPPLSRSRSRMIPCALGFRKTERRKERNYTFFFRRNPCPSISVSVIFRVRRFRFPRPSISAFVDCRVLQSCFGSPRSSDLFHCAQSNLSLQPISTKRPAGYLDCSGHILCPMGADTCHLICYSLG